MTSQALKQTEPTLAAVMAELQAAAQSAAAAEKAFKRDIDKRIAELEQARAFAHRRMDIIKALAAVAPEGTPESCALARLKALFIHIEWINDSLDELDPTECEVRDALLPLAMAIEELARAQPDASRTATSPGPIEALAAFEAWYRQRFGCEFMGIFEERANFRPLVDF